MIDASNPDLSFDNMVKRYRLDKPMTTPDQRRRMRDEGTHQLIPEEPTRAPKELPKEMT
jgi:hypothetical protein